MREENITMSDILLEKLEDLGAEIEDTLDRMMGDKKMYLEFLEDLPNNENVEKLKSAIELKDYQEAARQAHSLKGVYLNLGLLPLADLCIEMLMLFRKNENEKACAILPEFLELYSEWISVIKDNLNK